MGNRSTPHCRRSKRFAVNDQSGTEAGGHSDNAVTTAAPAEVQGSVVTEQELASMGAAIKPKRNRSYSRRYTNVGIAAVGVVLLLRVLFNTELRLHFLTGASLTQGALVAAIALGVVLTYRGSGVVNFATGATAMYTAYVYTGLRVDGKLFIPPLPNPLAPIEGIAHILDKKSTLKVPHWPTFISFGGPQTLAASLLLSLLFCVLFGLVLHVLIFRPLRHAPPLAKVVASVGVLLFLQAIIVRRYGTSARPTNLGNTSSPQVHMPFSIRLNRDQVIVICIVIGITALLWALFRFTRFGLATRAAAENEKGAMLLGFSPEFLAGTNWILSTVISGLLGVLVAGNQGSVDPLTIALLVIPALSVALVGGLSSFGVTTAAAFGLAATQALIGFLQNRTWFPKAAGAPLPGVAALLPFLLIVGVLFLRGNSLPSRGAISSGRLPFAPNPSKRSTRVVAPLAVVACLALLLFGATPNGRLAIFTTLIGIVMSLSFVVITGYVGQISLAQMMLAGISGFTVSKLTAHGIHLYHHTLIPRVPFPFNAIVGAIFAMFVGLLVAIPALRVRGVNLAIVTFAFAIAMNEFLFKNPGVSGGFAGAPVTIIKSLDPKETAAGVGRGEGANVWFGVFLLVVVVGLCAMIVNLRRSATGRRFLATRSNERAAAAAGVNVASTKLTAFAIASFIAGLGGALAALRLGTVNQELFGDTNSLVVLAFAYLGGISCISGAVTAGMLVPSGVLFTILQRNFHVPDTFTLILGGLALIVTAVRNPEGIAGGFNAKLRERARAAEGVAATVGSSGGAH